MAEVPDQGARPLVFIHVPKTGGTTLIRRVLQVNEPGERTLHLGNVFKGAGGTSNAVIDRLRNGQGPDLRGVRIVTGHLPLGVREWLPRYAPKPRGLRYFTFMREPIDRTLSHYFQIRDSPDEPFELPPLTPDASLQDALDGGYIHDNLHTRMLSGILEPFGEVTDDMLERAKRNLRDELAFFGLTERFDESLALAKQRVGFRSILYDSSDQASRVNSSRPRGNDVPAGLLRAAERCNRYDIELYSYAAKLFDSAPEREQLDFEVELAAVRGAMAEGEIAAQATPPAGFGGDEEEWRMLVNARAALLRLEREVALHRLRQSAPRASTTGRQEGLESDLAAARSRERKLDKEISRLAAARAKEKELAGKRLETARSRVTKLEQEVKRLKARSGSRPRRSVKADSKTARPRPPREAKRGDSKPAGSGPRRDPKRGSAKRGPTPRGKASAGTARGTGPDSRSANARDARRDKTPGRARERGERPRRGRDRPTRGTGSSGG